MKTTKLLYACLFTAALGTLAACNREKEEEPGIGFQDAVFSVNVVSVGQTEATLQESATGVEGATFYGFLTSDVTSEVADVISTEIGSLPVVNRHILKSGTPAAVQVQGLRRGGKPYRYVVTGLTANGRVYGTPAEVIFETTGEFTTGEISVSYSGKDASQRNLFEISGTTTPFDYAVLSAEVAATYQKDKDVLNDLLAQGGSPESGDGTYSWSRLSAGDYVVYVFGVEENLQDGEYVPTLAYAKAGFTVEDTPGQEEKSPYEKWLGDWKFAGRGSNVDTWTFTEKVKDASYTVTGVEGQNFPFEVLFDAETGGISFSCNDNLGTTQINTENGSETATVGLYGNINYNGSVYYITGSYVIATGTLDSDEQATLTPGTVNISNLGQFELIGFRYYALVGEDAYIFGGNGSPANTLPGTLTRNASTPDPDGGYADFLGTWYAPDGTPFEIKQKEADKTYTVVGFETDVEAAYANGSIKFYGEAQYGVDPEYGLPIYLYGIDSDGYPEDASQNAADPYLLATGTLTDDGIALVGSEYQAVYGQSTYDEVIVGLAVYFYDEEGVVGGEGKEGYCYPLVDNPVQLTIPATLSKTKPSDPNPGTDASYEDFLGEWQLGRTVWTVSQKVAGSTYTVTGMDGISALFSGASSVEAAYDAENGQFYIMEQSLGEFNSDEQSAFANNPYGMCSDYLTGIFAYNNNNYGAYPLNTDNASKIFTAVIDGEGALQLTPGSCNYGTYVQMGFCWVIQSGDYAGKGNIYNGGTALPATLTRPTEQEEDNSAVVSAAYADFIGSWTDGTNTLTISAAEDGVSYNVTGIPGSNAYDPFVALYENGALTLSEQDLGEWSHNSYGACKDVLSGVFESNGTEYQFYPFNSDTPTKIATLQLRQSGNLTFEAADCRYGTFVGFSYAWVITNPDSEYVGRGNWEETFYLDGILKPASGSASAPASRSHFAAAQHKMLSTVMAPSLAQSSHRPAIRNTDGDKTRKAGRNNKMRKERGQGIPAQAVSNQPVKAEKTMDRGQNKAIVSGKKGGKTE